MKRVAMRRRGGRGRGGGGRGRRRRERRGSRSERGSVPAVSSTARPQSLPRLLELQTHAPPRRIGSLRSCVCVCLAPVVSARPSIISARPSAPGRPPPAPTPPIQAGFSPPRRSIGIWCSDVCTPVGEGGGGRRPSGWTLLWACCGREGFFCVLWA